MLCGFGALWLFRTLSSEEKRRVHDALIAGIVAGLLLLWLIFVAYRYSGIILVGADRGDPLTAVSSGQAIIAMLSGLAWCVLLQRRRRGAALLLIAATLASFAPLPSNYAILAVILGVLGMVWGTSLHSSGLKALAVALVAAVLAGPIIAATSIHGLADDPVLIATIKRVDSTGSFERSIRHRLQIWAFVAERAQEHPYLGWGLDASRRIPGGNELTSLGAEKLPLHPHNGILQVWLELGVPGVVLLALIVGYATVARLGGRNPPHVFAVRAATILPTLTIAGLAFGIWQNWWFSAIWLTVALVATFPAVDAAQASARR